MSLSTYCQLSHSGVLFRCCRIFPEYDQKFLSVPALLSAMYSLNTSQKIYLTVDTKDSFTDYGSFTENQF